MMKFCERKGSFLVYPVYMYMYVSFPPRMSRCTSEEHVMAILPTSLYTGRGAPSPPMDPLIKVGSYPRPSPPPSHVTCTYSYYSGIS